MPDNPKKEILLDPRWSILEDGIGYIVMVMGGIKEIDKDNRKIIRLWIKPDEIVRKRYNLRKGIELNEDGNMELIVLEADIIPLNLFDDANKKWLYVKTLKGERTDLSEREQYLKDQINSKERRINLIEADNIRLCEQLELARLNPAKFMNQGMEILQKAAGALSDMNKPKEVQNG